MGLEGRGRGRGREGGDAAMRAGPGRVGSGRWKYLSVLLGGN